MEIMGLTKETPQPQKGEFDVDENNEPTGVLKETIYKVYDCMDNPTKEDIKSMILEVSEMAVSKGLTSIQTEDLTSIPGENYKNIIDAYMELSLEGKLPVRIYEQCALPNKERFDSFIKKGYRTGQGNDFFRLGPLKLFCDGSLGARTAWLKEPYSDATETFGIGLYEDSTELFSLVEEAHKIGMSVAIHCIGDKAASMAIEAIESAVKAYPGINNRHGIIHAQILDKLIVEKLRDLNIIAYIQPIFIEYDLHMAEDRIGHKRMEHSYNWRELLENGIKIPFGTDCPVESFNPLWNLYSAVTRKDLDGFPKEGWYKEQGLTIAESIDSYTRTSAYASFEEDVKGTIEIGKFADLVIIDKDLYKINPDEIKDCKVLMTIVDGKIRYSRNKSE